jgi:hypothetical protein
MAEFLRLRNDGQLASRPLLETDSALLHGEGNFEVHLWRCSAQKSAPSIFGSLSFHHCSAVFASPDFYLSFAWIYLIS